jgi:hypothetical protein
VAELRKNFSTGISRSASYRREQLKALAQCLEENKQEFVGALHADLHKVQYVLLLLSAPGKQECKEEIHS